ncbi:D-glycerate dehydrogenase [Chryseomicrobium sp. FSL W7-1435]|uniref:2-hydroxyacid dehydrogenase n=1 Tax=Chryseomicrobium sp. FSL W7-1435 TaxID=2921704 RepID=UPI00315A92CC
MNVFATRKLPEEIVEKLKQHVEYNEWHSAEQPMTKEQLLEAVKKADGVISVLSDPLDKEVLDAAPNLKVISQLAVGFNNIDVQEATKRSVRVTNTPDVLTNATADLTFALLLAASRKLSAASAEVREGKWQSWSLLQLAGKELSGSTIGILGFGRIGQAVARRAKGFDMNVIYWNRSKKPEAEQAIGATYHELGEVLKQADFLVIMLPFAPELKYLIGAEELALMKEDAILVNTARGGLVDEAALYEALKNNKLGAAGLDVFEQEPVPTNHPLLSLPNVEVAPHIGSSTVATRMEMADLTVRNLLAVLDGKEPETPVN